MLKSTNKASLLIDDYIESLPTFSKEICAIIRKLIHQSTKISKTFICFHLLNLNTILQNIENRFGHLNKI